MAKMTKKRNPQDATLRNIRAAARRLANLTRCVKTLEERVAYLEDMINPKPRR